MKSPSISKRNSIRGNCGANERRTDLVLLVHFSVASQRVRAARVGPHAREGDLFVGSSLEQEFARFGVEQKDGKGAVQRRTGF